MKYTKLFLLTFLLLLSSSLNSQSLKHELGIMLGSTSMQTDYGQRGDFASTYGNIGYGIGGVYYLSFNEKRRRWNDRSSFMKGHIRLKGEVSYMSSKLVHRGDYTRNIKMAAMQGSTKLINFGGQLEYSIFDFSDLRLWEPYVSTGLYFVNYDTDVTSSLGDWRTDNSLLPAVYLNDGLFLGKGKTQAFSFGGGTRYSKNKKTSFILDFRWQRFLNDHIDGLDPKLAANKYNDWLLFFNVAYVYKFY